jgi:hypothetical protein
MRMRRSAPAAKNFPEIMAGVSDGKRRKQHSFRSYPHP